MFVYTLRNPCFRHGFRALQRPISTRVSAIQRCVADYSVEVTPSAARKVASFHDVAGLHPGTAVNVTFLVGDDIAETVSTCRRLSEARLRAVPHVPARAFKDLAHVEDYLVQLVDAGVSEVLVIGGGNAQPVGCLSETLQILESGLLQKHGVQRVGVAAHPEGHPDVAEDVMMAALLRKAEWANANSMDLYYETQFCFEASPIIEWEQRVRALLVQRLGTAAPLPRVHLGVAGPARISSLIKFASMSGVGPSIRFVTKYTGNVLKLATKAAPDELIDGIARYQSEEPACLVQRLHFYTFGGLQSTCNWVSSVADGRFDVAQSGFTLQ